MIVILEAKPVQTLPELEAYFATAKLPATMDLDIMKILNVREFINSHVAILKSNPGNGRYMPFYNRLREVAQKLKQD